MNRQREQRNKGSVYVLVMSVCLLLTTIGLGALIAVRVDRRTVQLTQDTINARMAAQSALAWGLTYIEQTPNWRSDQSNGTWLADQSLGQATWSLQVEDDSDSDLSNSDYHPVRMTGIGSKGQARHQAQLTLIADTGPLEALNYCLHAGGDLTISSGYSLTVVGAPASTNGQLNNGESIDGNVNAVTVAAAGTITGTLNSGVDSLNLPDANLINDYITLATEITSVTTMDKQILTPDYNPWGTANSEGVYYIDSRSSDFKITNSRICGTLIINVGSNSLLIEDADCIEPYRSDYPTLIVIGNTEIKITSASDVLSETNNGTNYNTYSAPYQSSWDTDTSDEYPNKIVGLLHITGTLTLQETARIEGVVICAGDVTVAGDNILVHDDTFYNCPPEGYQSLYGMIVSPGSYCQVVD